MSSRWEEGAPKIIRNFLVYMQTIKGKSPRTVEQYYIDLRTFFRFILRFKGLVSADTEFEKISIESVDSDLAGSITLTDIYEFLYFTANERANNAATRARKVSCLRSFYHYSCEKTGVIKDNPTVNLDTPKKKRTLPKHLTLEECMELLTHIDGDFKERDYCILTLFLNCGLRLSELCGLNLGDIGKETINVTGKGNKERTVYLNDACVDAINNYLKVRPNAGAKDKNALFLSRLHKRISPKTVQWLVKKYLADAGLSGKGYSTHKLRHTAATLMYQNGGVDIRVLQEILGHESLSTTQIYTHLSNPQMRDAAEKNPLANVKVKNPNNTK